MHIDEPCEGARPASRKFGKHVYLDMCGPSEFTITGTLKNYERVDRLKQIKTPTLLRAI